MGHLTRVAKNEDQKEIVKIFNDLQGRHNLWQLWADFVVLMACAISNAVDMAHRDAREESYRKIASGYSQKELDAFAQIFALLVNAYERDSNQDLLGELYMALGLGNDSGGQFFTPYDVCRAMAEMMFGDVPAKIEKKGWVSVNDPAVGAGALLIAFANVCLIKHINYQQHVLFVAQDIDYVTACMCYIQLSLLGCAGYVYVGNTITDPCTALDGNALIPAQPEKCWFTPMYFHQTWHFRRLIWQMQLLDMTMAVAKSDDQEEESHDDDSESPVNEITQSDNKKGPSSNDNTHGDNEIEYLANDSGQLMLF